MFTKDQGSKNFQQNSMMRSTRRRGNAQRNQRKTNTSAKVFPKNHNKEKIQDPEEASRRRETKPRQGPNRETRRRIRRGRKVRTSYRNIPCGIRKPVPTRPPRCRRARGWFRRLSQSNKQQKKFVRRR